MKLRLQGGKSVQKKRCPFFFFEGGAEPAFSFSFSEPSRSPSESWIALSSGADAVDCTEEPSLLALVVVVFGETPAREESSLDLLGLWGSFSFLLTLVVELSCAAGMLVWLGWTGFGVVASSIAWSREGGILFTGRKEVMSTASRKDRVEKASVRISTKFRVSDRPVDGESCDLHPDGVSARAVRCYIRRDPPR